MHQGWCTRPPLPSSPSVVEGPLYSVAALFLLVILSRRRRICLSCCPLPHPANPCLKIETWGTRHPAEAGLKTA